MRLTLRAMLGFLNNELEPADAEDIGKKIAESEQATAIMHRIRDVMRRMRLAAPGLHDRGPNLDPNTVAEYLDNVLPGDRVPDFEKVCLDSDIHLAEVASCHEILTLVLHEAAQVDPAARQRMYQAPQVLAARLAGEGAAPLALPSGDGQAGQPPAAEGDPKSRPRPEVPAYLREPAPQRRRWLPTVAACVVVVGLGILVLLALGQFEPDRPLGRLLGLKSAAEQGGEPAKPSAPATPAAPATPVAVTKPADTVPAPPLAQPPGVVPGEKIARPPEEPAPMPPESPLAGPPGTVTPPGEPKPPATPGPAVEPKPGEPAAKPPAGPTEVAMNSSTKPPVEPPAGPGKEPGVGPILEPAAPVGPAQPLGRLVSDKQLLLAFDKKAAGWVRAPSKGVLVSRDRVLALPTFRPEVGLSTGLTLRLLGGTEIELLPGDAQMPMGINVLFGRAVLVPLANPGSRLRVAIGERAGVITFAQAEAVAALEVTPVRSPGTDPEKVPSQLNATLVAVSGELTWEQPGLEKPLKLSAPAQVTFQGPAVVGPAAAELPKWINAETLSALDARASVAVEQALQSDRPAVQTLLELAEHRQREVRWLASRSLVYLGRFDDLVSAMNVADPKSDWQEYVAKLSEAIALGAENAAAVRAALEKQYGAGAGELYRMLWGYSQKDLEDGDDAKLVAGLDHDNIAFRALSFWNLKEITGAGRLYRPELPAAQRKQSVQRWKECLDKKEIRHRPGEPGVKPPPPPEPPIELN